MTPSNRGAGESQIIDSYRFLAAQNARELLPVVGVENFASRVLTEVVGDLEERGALYRVVSISGDIRFFPFAGCPPPSSRVFEYGNKVLFQIGFDSMPDRASNARHRPRIMGGQRTSGGKHERN